MRPKLLLPLLVALFSTPALLAQTIARYDLVIDEIMDVNWGLEPEEVAKGFILTCQSHPKTEKVTVDFDAR